MVSRNTITVRAMAPISSCAVVSGICAEVSPSASRFITRAQSSSGRVMERPIRQLKPRPISTTARPIHRMKLRMRARDAASAMPASLELSRAAAMILSASGSRFSMSRPMTFTSGSIFSTLVIHCANV